MGFMSELVTLIWLIVEQSAVEQPVQTRFQTAGVPGTGRALPREQPGLRGLGRTGSRESGQSTLLPGMLLLTDLSLRGSSGGHAWQPHLQVCNPSFDPRSAIQSSGVRRLELRASGLKDGECLELRFIGSYLPFEQQVLVSLCIRGRR